jgi:hypothetical protein
MGVPGPVERTQVVNLYRSVVGMGELGAHRVGYHLQEKRTPALEKPGVLHLFSNVGDQPPRSSAVPMRRGVGIIAAHRPFRYRNFGEM